MTDVLNWSHAVSEIGEAGLAVPRDATEAERQAVATALEILDCRTLVVDYRIEAMQQGRYVARGTIDADVVQSCVVTLDPVDQHISELLDVEFRPSHQIEPADDGEHVALGSDDPEPIENGRLPIGRVVYELIASALDPYPRAGEAALEGEEGVAAPKDSKAGAFAALAKWRPKEK
jgi:uncharacterized metal-binding protein YceD (DUF177 family)